MYRAFESGGSFMELIAHNRWMLLAVLAAISLGALLMSGR
jgi:hypothetical protein